MADTDPDPWLQDLAGETPLPDPDRPDELPLTDPADPPEDDYSLFDSPVGDELNPIRESVAGLPDTPPAKTLEFALRAAAQLELARARLQKKGGVTSSADLAGQMGFSSLSPQTPSIHAEADAAATAAINAELDDMFADLSGADRPGVGQGPAITPVDDSPGAPTDEDTPGSPSPGSTGSLECTGNVLASAPSLVDSPPHPPAAPVMAKVMPGVQATPGQPTRDYFKDLDALL